MKPKEKAQDLFVRIYEYIPDYVIQENKVASELAKQCAIIAVDEIIKLHKGKFMCEREEHNEDYWKQVKQELERL